MTSLVRIALFLLLLLGFACGGERREAPPGRPNIILVIAGVDPGAADSTFEAGGLTRLAREGLRLDGGFRTGAAGTPERASLLTGQFGHRHGVLDDESPFDTSQLTFPRLLRAAGYRTAAVGAWPLTLPPAGFDYWCVRPAADSAFREMGRALAGTGSAAGRSTDFALAWLDTLDRSQPFFLLIDYPPPDAPSYLTAVNENAGRLLDYLDRTGLAGHTLVMLAAETPPSPYGPGGMPLWVRFPGLVPDGTTSDALVLDVDLAPTLLDFAGVDIPAAMPGRSLRPVLETERPPAGGREAVYFHSFESPDSASLRRYYGLRTRRYQLSHAYAGSDSWALYDLGRDDSAGRRNLYAEPAYAAVRDSLLAALRDLQRQYGDEPAAFTRYLTPERIDHRARGARVTVSPPPDPRYATADLTDGRYWSYSRYAPIRDRDWLGWRGGPVTINVDLGAVTAVRRIRVNVRQRPAGGAYYPDRIDGAVSADGQTWSTAGGYTMMDNDFRPGTEPFGIDLPAAPARFVRLTLYPMDYIPSTLPGGGTAPWLMVDEVVVE